MHRLLASPWFTQCDLQTAFDQLRDTFLSEALYEADKAHQVRFSAMRVCVFTRWQTEQTVSQMYVLVCV